MGKRDLKFQMWGNMHNRPAIELRALALTHLAAIWSIVPAGSLENFKDRLCGVPKTASPHLRAQTAPSTPDNATLSSHLHRKPLSPHHLPGLTAPNFMETSLQNTKTKSQGHKVLPTTDPRAAGAGIMRTRGKGCPWGLRKY